jgi:uncharacterized protein
MSIPFTFKVQGNANHYLYDVNSNAIMRVDEPLYELIDRVSISHAQQNGTMSSQVSLDDRAAEQSFSAEVINRTLETIRKSHDEMSFFSGQKPSRMTFPFTAEEIGLILNHVVGHVILNVTEQCNLRCSYCKFTGSYPLSRTHSTTTMSEAVAHRAIQFMISRSEYLLAQTNEDLSIGFYGGEPLLAFNLIKSCVDYVRDKYKTISDRIRFSLTSNLTSSNEAALNYLMDNGFYVLVSLDGPECMHDRYRKSQDGKGTFHKVIRNLHAMKARNPENYANRVGFSVVLAPPYDLEAVVNFFAKEELTTRRRLSVSFVDSEDTTFFDQFDDFPRMMSDLKNQQAALRDNFVSVLRQKSDTGKQATLSAFLGNAVKDIFMRRLVPLSDSVFPNGICLPGFQRAFVSPSGQLSPCEKIGYALSIGDIYSGFDIEKIYRAIEAYIAVSQSDCTQCWAVRFCKLCFVSALRNEFDVKKKRRECAASRRGLVNAMSMFSELMEADPAILSNLYGTDRNAGGLDVAFKFLKAYREGWRPCPAENPQEKPEQIGMLP